MQSDDIEMSGVVLSDDNDDDALRFADEKEDSGERELVWRDTLGNSYKYLSRPMTQACVYILLQEMCERLAFYGLMPTLKPFLKKYLNLIDNEASAYIGWFQGAIYLTPLLSAVLADTVLGVFSTILVFSGFYMAGLVFLCLAAFQGVGQPWMVHVGLMGFIALGSGGIKSCVNVFGAQQFHPEHHKTQMTSFFTFFYACINIGALVGGIICPQMAENVSFFAAYTIPLASFGLAMIIFAAGSSKYVRMKPQGSPVLEMVKVLVSGAKLMSLEKCKKSNGGLYEDKFIEDVRAVLRLMPIFLLEIPLLIAYNQMSTAFLTQGEKMDCGSMSPAQMQNVDPIVVILASLLIDGLLYPALRKRDLMPAVLTRFIFGNLLGCLSVMCAYAVEIAVMGAPIHSVPIWWQVPQFTCIAVAEIFLISTSYEVAFTFAPYSLKAVSSALNLLFFSLAGFLSGLFFVTFADWMPNFDPKDPTTYQGSHYDYYYLVLAGVCGVGALGCFTFRPYYRRIAAQSRK